MGASITQSHFVRFPNARKICTPPNLASVTERNLEVPWLMIMSCLFASRVSITLLDTYSFILQPNLQRSRVMPECR